MAITEGLISLKALALSSDEICFTGLALADNIIQP